MADIDDEASGKLCHMLWNLPPSMAKDLFKFIAGVWGAAAGTEAEGGVGGESAKPNKSAYASSFDWGGLGVGWVGAAVTSGWMGATDMLAKASVISATEFADPRRYCSPMKWALLLPYTMDSVLNSAASEASVLVME